MTGAPIFVATLLLASCSSGIAEAPPGVFFPTVPIGDAYPLAIFEGTLEVDGGCVYIGSGTERWLPLWPEGYRAERHDGDLRVIGDSGNVVGVEGGAVRVVGGESRPTEAGGHAATIAWAEGLTGSEIPPRCGDVFLIVSPFG